MENRRFQVGVLIIIIGASKLIPFGRPVFGSPTYNVFGSAETVIQVCKQPSLLTLVYIGIVFK